MRKILLTAISLVMAAGLIGEVALAQGSGIYIKLGEAKTKKSLLAMPALQYFGSSTSKSKSAGSDIFATLTNDLNVSSYFQFIPQSAFLEDTAKVGLTPGGVTGFKFTSWSTVGAEFLIRAGYSIVGSELTLETYTYHVPQAKLIFGKKYKGNINSARRMAHTFANDILKELTGKTGMFLSKVVATSDRGGGQFKEVYTMDWDAFDIDKITNLKTIAISPAWSPDAKKIAYTAYVARGKSKFRNADLFLHDVATRKSVLTSYRKGINSGASFAPDNKHIFLTISEGKSPDIYKMAYDGTLIKRITTGPNGAMNVEPVVSPDGNKIAFSSDRVGRPMIYTMNVDGSSPKRITFAGVFNSSPSWSPDGKKLAFAGQSESNFDIFVVDADGTNMIRLTSAKKPNGKGASNEDPSFSPDGRFVMFTSNRTGKNQIYISTADGTEERRVTTDNHNYYKPKWSENIE